MAHKSAIQQKPRFACHKEPKENKEQYIAVLEKLQAQQKSVAVQ
jgi:hypothetical protein